MTGALPLMRSDGTLLLDRASGDQERVDPKSGSDSFVKLASPRSVQAAAVDSSFVYVLSRDMVLRIDHAGRLDSTYQLNMRKGFSPEALGVVGKALYLADNQGNIERLELE